MQIEPERYELAASFARDFDFDRRSFFRTLGFGLAVFGLIDVTHAQESGRVGRPGRQGGLPDNIGAWLHIGEDGSVRACTGKAEVGQNTRTALVQAVAEELHVPVGSVTLVMADTDLVPYDMGTFGSRSMPDMLPRMLRVSAAAREVLKQEAERTGKPLKYGELVKGKELLATVRISDAPLTPPSEWKTMGTSVPKVDGRDFVTGRHKYASDLKLPGMIIGTSEQRASVNSKYVTRVASVQASSTSQVSSGDSLYKHLKAKAEPHTESTKGSFEEGLKAADRKLSATYTVAYIAHAPLEPRAAVAQWENGKLTVWTGTQVPFGVRSELAEAFSIPQTQVRVIVPDTGSGYGGKHTGEAALEAAQLAKSSGKPVKVVWTREDEFRYAYHRPAGVIEVQSGVRNDGTLTAWEFRNCNSGASGLATLYEVPHQRVHFHRTDSPLRQGSYRGLAATANHFAREVHMDELAVALRDDPLEFRLKNLKDARLRAVFQRAAEKFGWGRGKAANGRGFGIGGGFEKGGYVATCAEVSTDKDLKNFRVERVVIAFECGAIVNPDALRHQVEGAVIMGLGGALTEAIQFQDGRILNPRFSKYRVPRFRDVPVIESVLIDRKDLPSAGAGETPIVGIAPAIGNAIFGATGLRLRSMPMLGEQMNS